MTLLEELKSDFAKGLTKKASQRCSVWAQNYVVLGNPIPGPLRFEDHPWSREMHDCETDWAGMKCAQMAFTQTAIDRALHTIDILGMDVLYILPKKNPDASDFSKGKFDPILEMSPHISQMFSNVKNTGHKQAGHVNLYIRGARSRSGLKLISVALQIYDEYDEMPVANIALAEQRSAGYQTERKQKIKLSTPTIPKFGIAEEYDNSTKERYLFPCPNCGKQTELIFPDCLVITADSARDKGIKNSHIILPCCKAIFIHESKKHVFKKAYWQRFQESDVRGFYINKLYSTVTQPWEIAKNALKAREDAVEEQEYYNSDGGLPHVTKGAKVDDEQIFACLAGHSRKDAPPQNQLITMGVDIGKFIHLIISQWLLPQVIGNDLNIVATKKVLLDTKINDFEQLDAFMYAWQVLHCVVDANPDTRKAFDFANRFPNSVHLCYFSRGMKGKNIQVSDSTRSISVDRTSWLDLSQGRFKKGKKGIILPKDITQEFKDQIKTLVRIEKKDPDGNPTAKYVTVGGQDHFGLALCYDEIALPLAMSRSENKNVNDFL